MPLEVVPPLPVEQQLAVSAALEQAGVRLDGLPDAYRNAWRRRAAREAVENQPEGVRYTPSPRSTRGATRA
jgi:hypothetical protein